MALRVLFGKGIDYGLRLLLNTLTLFHLILATIIYIGLLEYQFMVGSLTYFLRNLKEIIKEIIKEHFQNLKHEFSHRKCPVVQKVNCKILNHITVNFLTLGIK